MDGHEAPGGQRRARDGVCRDRPGGGVPAVTFDTLLPFPDLRVGWGLDAHWGALAREKGWRLGIVDATPITHGIRKVAAAYSRKDAIAEGRLFLADRPYVKASEAQQTLVTHRSW